MKESKVKKHLRKYMAALQIHLLTYRRNQGQRFHDKKILDKGDKIGYKLYNERYIYKRLNFVPGETGEKTMKTIIMKLYRTWNTRPVLAQDSRAEVLYSRSMTVIPHKAFSNLI